MLRRIILGGIIAILILPVIFLLGGNRLMERLRVLFPGDTSNYDEFIELSGVRHGVDHRLLKAVIKAESGFDYEAVSVKGAVGLMQLMPITAREMGVADPFDPKENIDGGAKYLRRLLDRFNNNAVLALAAYNAGPETVKRYKGVPPFKETRRYLKKVIKFYAEYRVKDREDLPTTPRKVKQSRSRMADAAL